MKLLKNFLNENICYGYSLKESHRDDEAPFNEYPQHTILAKIEKYTKYGDVSYLGPRSYVNKSCIYRGMSGVKQ